ncbi:N-acetylneuraminate synthase family protein [Nodularia spumigena CS-584]|uniref:N-acetylneuraminate synthase family protein n=1 Tax=Nodularia spumigena TaxID=70799 RepID=UPI0000EA9A87|nr:N-acetylneuraminate synthase family protein [Nodularia spumigena]AHJ28660.1 N-acetylneuraminate synthase [Nodularia spumigena CCY9414]EAW43115.1 sialic acid synthase [Nodularia spumigena CCY9414]MDB9381730.1 N-acetylneuraminate synthase family protein [Nodularia spumigena CS-584]
MIIDKNLSKYIVFAEDDIINALKKISDNKNRIIFSVTESGVLEGVLTDGDFRRWLVQQDTINLNQPVSKISNKNYKYIDYTEDPAKIQADFSKEIEFIPLLDKNRHLVAVACRKSAEIRIGNFIIDAQSPTFVIAEIGNNHNGSLELAKQLIDAAIASGADCAKFQLRDLKSLYSNAGNANDASEDLGSQYTLDLLTRFQLTPQEMFAAFDYCRSQGILALCTPWDLESLALLEEYRMQAYKVASADLTNHDLLTALAKTGKPLLCSTGMATEQEISEAVALLKRLGAMYVLLHCNSTYPAPFKDVNLNYIERLKEIGDCPVGYSGHERGINIAIASVAKGAKVIEKHFTLDKTMEGNDHKVSLLPDEFRLMVEGIRQVEQSLGESGDRKLSQGELMNRETLAKSLVINCDLAAGEMITAAMIEVKSPGKGLQPNRKAELIGKRTKRNFKIGDFFYPSDLEHEQVKARNYNFQRPWGLPVRYHDFQALLGKSNPDLLEFHLSYKDLEQDINQFFQQSYDLDLVVHAPELFAGDHLLDLCSQNEAYRQRSIAELQRVIEITRKIKPYFKQSVRPCIVTNVGGFTLDVAMERSQREQLYELLSDSLSQLDATGVEVIPQTMPPFPWHFGGQRYHNLFVNPQDTADFCRQYGYRVCLDISHSKLACNHHKWSFKEFIEQVGTYVAHLHIADSEGSDGEGLQIGEGEIDFPALAEDLEKTAPNASFIPEIWQGHKNEGEGFWMALERLEFFLSR